MTSLQQDCPLSSKSLHVLFLLAVFPQPAHAFHHIAHTFCDLLIPSICSSHSLHCFSTKILTKTKKLMLTVSISLLLTSSTALWNLTFVATILLELFLLELPIASIVLNPRGIFQSSSCLSCQLILKTIHHGNDPPLQLMFWILLVSNAQLLKHGYCSQGFCSCPSSSACLTWTNQWFLHNFDLQDDIPNHTFTLIFLSNSDLSIQLLIWHSVHPMGTFHSICPKLSLLPFYKTVSSSSTSSLCWFAAPPLTQSPTLDWKFIMDPTSPSATTQKLILATLASWIVPKSTQSFPLWLRSLLSHT